MSTVVFYQANLVNISFDQPLKLDSCGMQVPALCAALAATGLNAVS
jgi:hypothetical protein